MKFEKGGKGRQKTERGIVKGGLSCHSTYGGREFETRRARGTSSPGGGTGNTHHLGKSLSLPKGGTLECQLS